MKRVGRHKTQILVKCLACIVLSSAVVQWPGSSAHAQSRPVSEPVKVQLTFVRDDAARTPFKKDELPWPHRYAVFAQNGPEWLPTTFGDHITITADAAGMAVGTLELPPRKYRIKGHSESYQPALCWDQEFTVAEDRGQVQRLEIVYKSASLTKCILTVKGPSAGNVSIAVDPPIAIVPEGADTGKRETTRKLKATIGSPTTFYVWPEINELDFTVGGYFHGTSAGTPQRKTMKVDALAKGAEWTIEEQKPVATISVMLQTEQGDKPLTQELWNSEFSENSRATARIPFLTYELWEVKDTDNGNHRRAKDGGHFDWESGQLAYIGLQEGHTYAFPPFLYIGKLTLPVLKGARAQVKLPASATPGATVPSLGTIVIGSKPPHKWKVSGVVKSVNGQPLLQAFVSLSEPYAQSYGAMTDKDGQYSITAIEGQYEMTVMRGGKDIQKRSIDLSKDLVADYVLKDIGPPRTIIQMPGSSQTGGRGATTQSATIVGSGPIPFAAVGPGGGMAKFGIGAGGPKHGPRVSFGGLGGAAHHVVYLIDRSASMAAEGSMDKVKNRMRISLANLSEVQDFHVIFFGKDTPQENQPKRLVPATLQHKIAAAEYIETVSPGGTTDPLPALGRAFDVLNGADAKLKGKLIFLFTDGDFKNAGGNQAVVDFIAEKNKDKSVHINTCLLGKVEGKKSIIDTLKRIADQNGGEFKVIAE